MSNICAVLAEIQLIYAIVHGSANFYGSAIAIFNCYLRMFRVQLQRIYVCFSKDNSIISIAVISNLYKSSMISCNFNGVPALAQVYSSNTLCNFNAVIASTQIKCAGSYIFYRYYIPASTSNNITQLCILACIHINLDSRGNRRSIKGSNFCLALMILEFKFSTRHGSERILVICASN